MRVLFIDWETTDLYLKGEPSEHPNQPWPCSLSAILDDDTGSMRRSFYSLINVPPGTVWAPKAYEANRLSAEICNDLGIPLALVMDQLIGMAHDAEAICAFSAYFDVKFAKIACAKLGDAGNGMRPIIEMKQRLCTMETSARHLKGEGQRFIKLVEAHRQIIGRDFEGAHNALFDNLASRAVYYALKAKGVTDFSDTKVLKEGYAKAPARAKVLTPEPEPAPLARKAPVKPTKAGKPGAIF